MMELYSLAQAPGLTILNFDLKTESKINISVAKIPFSDLNIVLFKTAFITW